MTLLFAAVHESGFGTSATCLEAKARLLTAAKRTCRDSAREDRV